MSTKLSIFLEIRSSECIWFVIRVFCFNLSKNLDEVKLISLTNKTDTITYVYHAKTKPLGFCRELINDIA